MEQQRARRRDPCRRPRRRATTTALLLVLALAATTSVSAAETLQEIKARQQQVRQQRAQVAARVDLLKASEAEVHQVLDALEANVAGQEAIVADARAAEADATAKAHAAQEAVRQTKEQLAGQRESLRELVVDSYVNPPSENVLGALEHGDIAALTQRRALLGFTAGRSATVIDEMRRLQEDLEIQERLAAEAVEAATARRNELEAQLQVLEQALAQHQAVVDEVEARLEAVLAEAEALAALDAELAARHKKAEEELRRRVVVTGRAGRAITPIGPISVVTVGGITVNAQIAEQVRRLLADAAAAGIVLGGGGYRDSSSQVALRRAHCGTSNYAVYQMPSSRCRPPTARPGASMHERGLAIDFTYQGRVISSRSSPAFRWLAANAHKYGLRNMPAEPWHWSTNGN